MNNYRIFENLANSLANKGIVLKVKPGSFINAISEFSYDDNGTKLSGGSNAESFVMDMANKLINELGLYRNSIFPIVKEFFSELNAKAPIVDTTIVNETSISTIEVKSNNFIEKLKDDGLLDEKVLDYGSGASLDVGVIFNNDFESLSDVSIMFKSDDFPETVLLDEVIQKYSNLELKNFLNKYGVMIYSNYSGSELKNDGRIDYRSLAIGNQNIIFYIDYICLMYGYVCNRISNKVATSTDLDTYDKDLRKVRDDLLKIISIYNNRLDYYNNSNILVVNNSTIDDDDRRKVWVVSSVMDKFLEEARIDAWSAVNACAHVINGYNSMAKDLYSLPYITKDTILSLEEKLVSSYQNYINLKLISNHNLRLNEVRKLYNIISNYLWDKYMSDDLAFIGLGADSIHTPEERKDIVLKEVEEYIKTCNDGDLTTFKPDVVFYIVGKIFFPRTSFYKFAMNTSGNEIFDNFSKLHPDNELSLSIVLLIVENIISNFE